MVLFFVGAVAFGAAAVLLAGPLPPSTPTGGAASAPLSLTVVGYVALGLLLVSFVFYIVNRARGGSQPLPSRYAATSLMTIVLLIAAFVIFRYVSVGGSITELLPPTVPPPTTPPPSGQNLTNVSFPVFQPLGLPGWLPFALVVGLIAAVVLVVVPLALMRAREREEASEPVAGGPDVREELVNTLQKLERDPTHDPRGTILALYAQLMRRVSGTMGDLSTRTPREIQRECVRRLGVSAITAAELTDLFEEARYSTHPMGMAEAEKARLALQHALADLSVEVAPLSHD